ncbi:MAG TPA: CAP domain-containing protein [Myxococcota bacterium]|nr:CAP domain-containing protein [Myxococcota bacterium]
MTSWRGLFGFAAAFTTAVWLGTAPLEALAGPEAELFARVNRVRAEHHLIPLRGSQELAQVARAHAEDMARRGYFAHESPEGHNALNRVTGAGITGFRLLAENIGASTVSGDRLDAIVEEWMRSHDHRENLLNPAFNTAGVGVVEGPDGQTLVVELYATYN